MKSTSRLWSMTISNKADPAIHNTPGMLHITLVTESLTLMAGTLRSPLAIILARLCTPVVVSSDRPRISVNTHTQHMAHKQQRK